MISLETLRRYPCFAGVGEDILQAIAKISTEESIDADRYLFREGETACKLYILTSGRMDILFVLSGGEGRIVDSVMPGDLLCWSALIPPNKTRASCMARTHATLVGIEADPLNEMCEKHPELGYRLMQQVATTLRSRLRGAHIQLAAGN